MKAYCSLENFYYDESAIRFNGSFSQTPESNLGVIMVRVCEPEFRNLSYSYIWPLKIQTYSYTWSSEMLTCSYTALWFCFIPIHIESIFLCLYAFLQKKITIVFHILNAIFNLYTGTHLY